MWDVDSLKEYTDKRLEDSDKRYEQRFIDNQQAVNAALTAAKEAVLKAETASEKRFEAVNEFRQTLADQASQLMPRNEAIQRADSNAEKISSLGSRLDKIEGRSGGFSAGWGYLIAAVGLALVVADHFSK
jgi:vacuolar-type H+-ATPase subunit I/STV1